MKELRVVKFQKLLSHQHLLDVVLLEQRQHVQSFQLKQQLFRYLMDEQYVSQRFQLKRRLFQVLTLLR